MHMHSNSWTFHADKASRTCIQSCTTLDNIMRSCVSKSCPSTLFCLQRPRGPCSGPLGVIVFCWPHLDAMFAWYMCNTPSDQLCFLPQCHVCFVTPSLLSIVLYNLGPQLQNLLLGHLAVLDLLCHELNEFPMVLCFLVSDLHQKPFFSLVCRI